MANVLFKRGLQANLPSTSAAVVDGAFYLTTDTNRLYVGQEGGTLKLLNQTVQIVAAVANLPSFSTNAEAQAHVNDFYYCTAENILCVWKENANGTSNYGWQQINKNTDTTNATESFTTSVTNDIGTISHSLVDSEGNSVTANFAINVNGGLAISTSGTNGLTITGKEYNLSRSVSENVATISLGNSTTSTTDDVVLRAGNNVTLSTTGTSGIIISSDNDVVNNSNLEIPEAGSLRVTVGDTAGNSTSATLANVGIVIGESGTSYVPIANTSGKTQASIYTKDEIDNLIKGLDGMTYKGTIAKTLTATVSSLPTTSVSNGDVYVVIEDGLDATDVGGNLAASTASALSAQGTRVGDMFIAVGSEDSATGYLTNPQWTYVPSGNDELSGVTYSTTADTATNTLNMKNGDGTVVMGIGLTAGNDITISSTVNGNIMTSTIAHESFTTTTSTTAVVGASSIPAISSITVDNGHITAIETTDYTPVGYQLHQNRASTTCAGDVVNGTRMATATNAGPNDLSFATTIATDDGTLINSSVIKLSSDTIKLVKGNAGEVVMNMEWGTF